MAGLETLFTFDTLGAVIQVSVSGIAVAADNAAVVALAAAWLPAEQRRKANA